MTKKEAILHFGSAVKLAKEMGISPQAITLWGDYPPIARQYQIQVLTNGQLKAEGYAAA
jgi:hypothetical protein